MLLPNRLKGYFKMCKKCKIVKPISKFNKRSTTKDGLQYWCKCCQKQYKIDNTEYIKQRQKQYDNKISGIISKLNSHSRQRFSEAQYICDFTLDMLGDFISFFKGKCPYTSKPLTNDNFEFDHIHARILGGEHAPWNIVIVTKEANGNKYAKDFTSWFINSEYYTPERYARIIYWQQYALMKYLPLLNDEQFRKFKTLHDIQMLDS